jgi:hypothetical protein
MAVFATAFDNYKHSASVFLDYGQRSAGRLQQCRQLSLNKTTLLIWIADVSERGAHVQRSARLAFK